MDAFLNPKRLRDYPRLFFIATWCVLLLNWALHNGWKGAAGQIIGNDFLVFYSAGLLFRTQPQALYDPAALKALQDALLAPTPLAGLVPFINPPYVAPVFALLTLVPLAWAFAGWTLLNIACAALACAWLSRRLAPGFLKNWGLSGWQLFAILGGYFGFIEGLEVGQNHGLTLLLVSGCVLLTLDERPLGAGLCAALLLYKPHFALPFLLLWLVWANWRALASFGLAAAAWLGASLWLQGWAPYRAYLELSPQLLGMYEVRSLGAYLEVTVYGLLKTLLGDAHWQWLSLLNLLLAALAALALGAYAWRMRSGPQTRRMAGLRTALAFAVLYPLLFAPHVLLHDTLILAVALLLWAQVYPSRLLVYCCVAIYLAAFFLPWAAYQLDLALLSLAPLGLAGLFIRQAWRTPPAQGA